MVVRAKARKERKKLRPSVMNGGRWSDRKLARRQVLTMVSLTFGAVFDKWTYETLATELG